MYVIFLFFSLVRSHSISPLYRYFLKKKTHILTSLDIQTFRRPTSRPPPARTTSTPQYQRRSPSMVWTTCDGWILSSLLLFFLDTYYETVRRYQPCFCYSCLFGCFHFQPPHRLLTSLQPHSSIAHPIPSYPLFGFDVRSSPLHCYPFFVSLILVLFFLLFLWWKDALDIIIPSSAGRNIFSYSSYLYPSTIYQLTSRRLMDPSVSRLPFSPPFLRLRI